MEEDVTMDVLSQNPAREPTFGALISRGKRLWAELAHRPWGQAPISLARLLVRPLPDRMYLALGYLCYFGKWPDYDNPSTFNEHIHEYMLRCRDPLLNVTADKMLCRSYIT